MPVVLRRRAQQRHAPDVDHLDRLLERAVRVCHSLFERIQIHHDQVDRLDPLLRELPHVLRVVAVGQDRRVNLRVQRLDAAVQQLRKAGDRLDERDRNARLRQHLRRAARGDQLDAKLVVQGARELDDARLVVNADQRSADLQASVQSPMSPLGPLGARGPSTTRDSAPGIPPQRRFPLIIALRLTSAKPHCLVQHESRLPHAPVRPLEHNSAPFWRPPCTPA